MNVNSAVLERYSEGAKMQQAEFCKPVDYDTGLLKSLTQEIIDQDYGCGEYFKWSGQYIVYHR